MMSQDPPCPFCTLPNNRVIISNDLAIATHDAYPVAPGPAGYNIGINDGAAADQTVAHLHIHLIPRYLGDQRNPRGGVRWAMPDKADYWSRPDRWNPA